MAKTEAQSSAMSADSVAYLEEVKKGKARKFAMICKGASVVSLVIYKKGNVEKHKKEAKEAGKGQFYFGVVDGKGQDIRFVLARADGFESEPVKTTVLKGFLDESAGMKCKPSFEIVDALPVVLDEDDPLVARYLQLTHVAKSACVTHPDRAAEINDALRRIAGHLEQEQSDQASQLLDATEKLLAGLTPNDGSSATPADAPQMDTPTKTADSAAAGFAERLRVLLPLIKAAADTPAGLEAKQFAGQAGAAAKVQDFAQANLLLDKAEAALQQPSPTGQQVDPAALFSERLKALLPAIKAAAGTAGGEQAKQLAGQAGGFAKSQDFVRANQSLDQAELALKGGPSNQSSVDPSAAFNQRLKALLPQIKSEAGSPAGEQAKLKAGEAGQSARGLDFAKANALLDDAEQLLKGVSSTAPNGDWASAKAAWQEAIETVDSQISQLQVVLRGSEDEELEEIAEFGLNALTGDHKVPLMAAIRDVDMASGDGRTKAAAKALQMLSEFEAHISSSEQVAAVDNNPFGVQSTIRSSLSGAFKALEGALKAMGSN